MIFDVLQFFAVFNERRCYAVYRHFTFYFISFRMAHFHHDGALMAHSNSAGVPMVQRGLPLVGKEESGVFAPLVLVVCLGRLL